MNTSPFPVVSTRHYRRHSGQQDSDGGGVAEDRFIFGYDMSRYWFESLGDCFAMSSSEIEKHAERVIKEDWKLSRNGHWDDDERARRSLYRERETWHSHGSYPQTDDLSFYLSYHAMFTAAGKLLATVPLHQDPNDPDDEFQDWLSRHLLTREDGRWLADRRDPKPLEWPSWKNELQHENWRWSVSKTDFDGLLGIGGARLNVWGHWNSISGSRENRFPFGVRSYPPNIRPLFFGLCRLRPTLTTRVSQVQEVTPKSKAQASGLKDGLKLAIAKSVWTSSILGQATSATRRCSLPAS